MDIVVDAFFDIQNEIKAEQEKQEDQKKMLDGILDNMRV